MSHKFLVLILYLTIMNTNAQNNNLSKNVSTFTIDAPQLKTEKKIWVYLPEGYNNSSEKYPVLYMHDGQNLFDGTTAYSGEWRIDEQLDSIKAKTIVIGIEHGSDKRVDELSPYINEKYGGGNADNYLDFLVNTLKPYVDENYRTKKDRNNTAILGSSVGGLVSFYAILKYSKVFGKAGIFSPSFWFGEEIYDLMHNTPKLDAKIYFMAGDHESNDMVADMDRMVGLVLDKINNKKVRKKIVHNGRHNETLWAKEFAEAYLWLMG